MNRDSLTLHREYPDIIGSDAGDQPLRVYCTTETYTGSKRVRWHFGFHKKLVEALCPLLESSPYWGEKHWAEDGDWWIWWCPYMTDPGEEPPFKDLNRWLSFLLKQHNTCYNLMKRWAKK